MVWGASSTMGSAVVLTTGSARVLTSGTVVRGGVGYTMVWVAPSTISGLGPLFVEMWGGPKEGFEVHAVRHEIFGCSTGIPRHWCSHAGARGAVQELSSPVCGWRNFCLFLSCSKASWMGRCFFGVEGVMLRTLIVGREW